mgnify:CR=1 FL=1
MAVNASDECSAAFELTRHTLRSGVMSAVHGRNKVEQGSCLALLRLVEAYRGSLKGLSRRTRRAAADLGGHKWSLDTAKGIPQRIVLQLSNQQAPCACVVTSKLVSIHVPIAQHHSVCEPRTGLHSQHRAR